MPVVFEYSFTVNPQYRLFTVFDPTCDEGENFEAARRTLGHGCFAWGPNAVVARAIDTGTVSVAVEVWDDPPGTPWGMPDEIAVAELVLPGGRFSSIQALEPAVHVGVELPTGAGTYGARIAAYNRGVSGGFAPEDAAPFPGHFEAYRLQLWKISDEPSWSDDDEESWPRGDRGLVAPLLPT
jgi:hypothetical protein